MNYNFKNNAVLEGNIGKENAKTFATESGAILTFNMATNKTWKDKDGNRQSSTEWHRCVRGFKTIESANKLAQYVTSGKGIRVNGELKYKTVRLKTLEGKEFDMPQAYIQVNSLEFTDRKGKEGEESPEVEVLEESQDVPTPINENDVPM